MKQIFANNARAELVVDNGGTLEITEGVNIPVLDADEFFLATLWTADSRYGSNVEIVKVSDVTGSTWTVERGQEGTSTYAHPAGTPIELRLTAGGLGSIAVLIDDNSVGGGKVWSSMKVSSELSSKSNNSHTHPPATSNSSGFMSSTDKAKLDAIPPNVAGVSTSGDPNNVNFPIGSLVVATRQSGNAVQLDRRESRLIGFSTSSGTGNHMSYYIYQGSGTSTPPNLLSGTWRSLGNISGYGYVFQRVG